MNYVYAPAGAGTEIKATGKIPAMERAYNADNADNLLPKGNFQRWNESQRNEMGFFDVVTRRDGEGDLVLNQSFSWDGNRYVETLTMQERELSDDIKSREKQRVKERAANSRYSFVTPGKEMIYAEKAAELQAFARDPAGNFPWAEKRATRKKSTVPEVMAEWKAKADAWQVIGQAIEDLEEGACEAIDAATTLAEVKDIMKALSFPGEAKE